MTAPLQAEKVGDRWIVYPLGQRNAVIASGVNCTEALQTATRKQAKK